MLDIGGGTTDVAVYSGGGAVHTSTIPVGGNILTNDIALGLKTTSAEAERVKRAYGSASLEEGEADEAFSVTTLDGRSTSTVDKAGLRAIIVPRLTEIFRMAKAQIAERVPREVLLAEVVIAGGRGALPRHRGGGVGLLRRAGAGRGAVGGGRAARAR